MPETFFGAIADDFTGATDLAAMLSRAGVPVTLRIGLPGPGAVPAPFEVIALKIRTTPPEDAVSEARAALRWLRKQGAQRLFWKYCSTFDSTPQGNIGPVADALMNDLGVERTVHCPAFPENGRRVFMGKLFVGEELLSESPMKDHPLTPMRDSDLQRLLAPQVRRETALVALPVVRAGAAAIAEAIAARRGHVVVDAVETEDLAAIAAAVAEMPLVCGGSAIAQPLPALWRAAGAVARADATLPVPAPGQVVLSGSCSAMTRKQVGRYLDAGATGYRLDPLELAKGQLTHAREWLAAQDPAAPKIIFATAEPKSVAAAQEALGVTRAGALVEEALAQLAQDARAMGIARIVVAGGETSGAVTRALGVESLTLGPEIAPGVPWCFTGDGAALALKSGNFGAETFFTDAFALLGDGPSAAAS
ncbi:3-oxo-tetronate kinase [Jannaschia ovalis]|uniref:3-oxo-tetronate kinase n=1 Tax=Jannaschia ovalis TaxID=3038773 RepID=A0ABY8LFY4_9RHOB|nr:3-oxo-tetronate kinase [Jannaschia sp. GRR-S6-38]WGH79108.1 four-carbon acid sugar kinase family protein [Jannaschia sp. GRR-S6-38]